MLVRVLYVCMFMHVLCVNVAMNINVFDEGSSEAMRRVCTKYQLCICLLAPIYMNCNARIKAF